MTSEEINYRLIALYLAGECSKKEEQAVRRWADENLSNKEKLEHFRRIWYISKKSVGNINIPITADEEWQKLRKRLIKEGEIQHAAVEGGSGRTKFQSSYLHSVTQKAVRVAAVFLVAGLIGVFAYQNWYQPQPKAQEPVLREITTDKGQQIKLTLSDGTKLQLNAESSIKFPANFQLDQREVFVEGEVYFDVNRDPGVPFEVHSRGADVRVLGTSFNVRAYPEDDEVQVVVREGKVSLEITDKATPGKAIITGGELGQMSLKHNKIETRQVEDLELYLSWTEGYLKFQQAAMNKVAKELERQYDVQVVFKDSGLENLKLTANLKSRSIRNVLDVISMSLDMSYQFTNNKVTFYAQSN